MAPLLKAFRAAPECFRIAVCLTGQHADLIQPILRLFDITPDYDLGIMQGNQTLHHIAAAVLSGLEPVLAHEQCDWMLVQGDTTTTLAAALAAHYARVSVAHVEAGLRSGDMAQPFPEEANRILADHLAQLHLAPTEEARQNLLAEGIQPRSIVVTGNSGIDALLDVAARGFDFSATGLREIAADHHRVVLVTAHRRESFGAPIRRICEAVQRLARRYRGQARFVFPVHPNPSVRQPVNDLLSREDNVNLIDPLEYEPFVHLMKRSEIILTDSGGVQEEAPALGVPVLVLRDVTERPEGVRAGCARVVGTDIERIVRDTCELLDDAGARARMAHVVLPYGDGHAARRTVEALLAATRSLHVEAGA